MDNEVKYLPFGDGEDLLPIQADRPARDTGSPFSRDPGMVGRDPGAVGRGPGEEATALTDRVEQSIDRVRRFGELAMRRLADMSHQPDRITIEMAVKVSAETGFVVAKTAAEANFTVSIEWQREKAEG